MDFSFPIIAVKVKKIASHPTLPLLLITFFALFGTKALIHSGFFTSHDGWHQLVRLYHFNQALTDGQLPPRWAGEALNGFGYPLFYFTYQLPFYLAQVFYSLHFTLWDSIKITFLIGYLLSGITMYHLAKEIWGKWGGFISAFLYLWAPYRFSTIFVRGSLGEHFTYIFIPLIFLGLWKLANLPANYFPKYSLKSALNRSFPAITILAIGISGVILSHAIVLQLLIIPVLIFSFGLLISSKQKRLFVFSNFLAVILSFAITAYYFLPAFNAKQWSRGLDQLYFNDHFITLKQLIYSPWGYGFSFPGSNDGMSFQLGIPQWFIIGISLFSVIILFLYREKIIPKKALSNLNHALWLVLILLLIFAVSIYLMIEPSRQLWESLRKYITFDFPWRYLTIPTFIAALLAGFPIFVVTQFKFKFHQYLIIAAAFSLFIISLSLYANRNHIRVNLYEQNPMQYVDTGDTSNTFDEYTPKWFPLEQKLITKPSKVVITHGTGKISDLVIKSNLISFTTLASSELTVKINQVKYPGWNLIVNGSPAPAIENGEGVWEFTINSGTNKVQLELKETLFNKVANSITVISILIIIGGLWQQKTQKQKIKQK